MENAETKKRLDAYDKIEELRKTFKLGGLTSSQLQEVIIQSEKHENAMYAMSQFMLNDRAVILHDEQMIDGIGMILNALARDMQQFRKECMDPYECE